MTQFRFDEDERRLENLAIQRPALAKSDDLWALKKEFQEFKAVVEEREKLKDRLWRERLGFMALLIASWGITITVLLRLFRLL